MKSTKNNKGFTLIEVLIAMFVSLLLMAGIYSIFMTQIRVLTSQEETAAVQQNLRSAMYIMEREIRMAGYKGTLSNIGGGFATADATSMQFSYLSDTTGNLTTVQYTFSDSDGDGTRDTIIRSKDGIPGIIAENIEQIEFFYRLVADDGTETQKTVPTDPTEIPLIKSVQVSLLARSAKSIPGREVGRAYETPSGNSWGNTSATATDPTTEDYNDGFYRRFITSNIICRNL